MSADGNRTILALESAGSACSAALWRGGAVARSRIEAMEFGHAQALMPMVEDVIGETGFAAIDLVAVASGPGAYTGLRIGLAAARGLALAAGLPCAGIGSFELHHRIARESGAAGRIAVVLETRREEFYFALFDEAGHTAAPGEVLDARAVFARLSGTDGGAGLAGDGAERLVAADPSFAFSGVWPTRGDAAVVAELAAGLAPDDISRTPPSPVYLRPPDTAPPRADRQRLR